MNMLLRQHGIRLTPGHEYTATACRVTGGVRICRKASGDVAVIAYIGFTAAHQLAWAINRHWR